MSESEVIVCIFIIETNLPREEIELWSGCDNSDAFFISIIYQSSHLSALTQPARGRRDNVVATSFCPSQRRGRYALNETPNDVSVERRQDLSDTSPRRH